MYRILTCNLSSPGEGEGGGVGDVAPSQPLPHRGGCQAVPPRAQQSVVGPSVRNRELGGNCSHSWIDSWYKLIIYRFNYTPRTSMNAHKSVSPPRAGAPGRLSWRGRPPTTEGWVSRGILPHWAGDRVVRCAPWRAGTTDTGGSRTPSGIWGLRFWGKGVGML